MNAYILAHVKIILRQILHRLKSWQSIQIKMAELEDIELTSHYKKKKKKASKVLLSVEQSSLKTNWKLVEGLGYNQGYKKDTHVIR